MAIDTDLRNLGALESEFYRQSKIGSADFCTVLFLDGPLDGPRLAQAVHTLLDAIPFLKANLSPDGHPRLLPASSDDLPLLCLSRQDDTHWRRIAEQEIRRQYQDKLLFVTALLDEKRSEILLSLCHALCDGLSGITIARALLDAYNGLALAPRRLSPPLEALLPPGFQGESGLQQRARVHQQEKLSAPERALRFGNERPTVVSQSAGFLLPQAAVEQLRVLAKHRQSNLFALICAASLQTAKACLPHNGETRAGLTTPANLRPALGAEADDLGLLMGFLVAWHDTHLDIGTLAQAIYRDMRQGLASGEALARAIAVPTSGAEAERLRPSISISNLGRVEDLPSLGKVRVSAHRGLVALWSSDPLSLVLQTCAGHLLVDVHGSLEKLGDGAAELFAAALSDRLKSLAAGT